MNSVLPNAPRVQDAYAQQLAELQAITLHWPVSRSELRHVNPRWFPNPADRAIVHAQQGLHELRSDYSIGDVDQELERLYDGADQGNEAEVFAEARRLVALDYAPEPQLRNPTSRAREICFLLKREFTRAKSPTSTGLPVIETADRQLRDSSAEAMKALVASNMPPHLFTRGGSPVRVENDEADRPIIRIVGESEMRHELTHAADFQRTTAKGPIAVAPPLDIVRDVLATPGLALPPLLGITQSPTLRADGSIFDTPGYDQTTGLLYRPLVGAKHCLIPVKPTTAEVVAARTLIYELLHDFPFDNESSRAGAIALIITPVVRPAIQGPVPLAAVDATQQGTGKGKLVDCAAIISTGQAARVEHAPNNDEEMDKRITSSMRDGDQIIALDDVDELKLPSLARALTAIEWKGRILGKSENVTFSQRATWAATGNNIRLGGDIARRCYWIRLDAQMSRPWEREGFRHPDLLGWVREHRAELVAALLTLARAWFAAGCPPTTTRPIGSFEDWTRVVGGILQHAEIPSFLENLTSLYDAADDEGVEWEAFLTAWLSEFGSGPVTTAQFYTHVKPLTPLQIVNREVDKGRSMREAIPATLIDQLDNEGRFKRMMGKALVKRVGRRFGVENLHIVRAADDSHNKVAQWQVKSAGLAGFAGLNSNKYEADSTKNHYPTGLKDSPQTPLTPHRELIASNGIAYGQD